MLSRELPRGIPFPSASARRAGTTEGAAGPGTPRGVCSLPSPRETVAAQERHSCVAANGPLSSVGRAESLETPRSQERGRRLLERRIRDGSRLKSLPHPPSLLGLAEISSRQRDAHLIHQEAKQGTPTP